MEGQSLKYWYANIE